MLKSCIKGSKKLWFIMWLYLEIHNTISVILASIIDFLFYQYNLFIFFNNTVVTCTLDLILKSILSFCSVKYCDA